MNTTPDPIRASFAARFSEEQAAKVEDAAQSHYAGDLAALLEVPGLSSTHGSDNFGTCPFRYWFLLAIGHECVTRYSDYHGITAQEKDLRDWAMHEGQLGEHDGDIPDYLAALAGAYDGWIESGEEGDR